MANRTDKEAFTIHGTNPQVRAHCEGHAARHSNAAQTVYVICSHCDAQESCVRPVCMSSTLFFAHGTFGLAEVRHLVMCLWDIRGGAT